MLLNVFSRLQLIYSLQSFYGTDAIHLGVSWEINYFYNQKNDSWYMSVTYNTLANIHPHICRIPILYKKKKKKREAPPGGVLEFITGG